MARQVNNLLAPLGFLKQRLLRFKSNGLLKSKHEAVVLLATAMALVVAAAILGFAGKNRECELRRRERVRVRMRARATEQMINEWRCGDTQLGGSML